MEEKHPTLITAGIILDKEYTDDQLDEISQQIYQKLQPVLDEISQNVNALNTQTISFTELDPEIENCFQCKNCNRWTTHGERSNYINGLPIGFTLNGADYCEACLIHLNNPTCDKNS